MPDSQDPLWYKDAIFYQLHVKAFFDANNDGIGDFAGLMAKLDYLQELGVTAIWILPFYPSPLRDDGYDIAEFRDVNPSYGAMSDFRAFVRAAHARGLKVITELVVNHTSDQHPWFQRARRAKPGSPWRDYYVWSDDDQLYKGTRIIFTDTETSNWAWDPVAKAYYWHRFFSHQPDLNFDNPKVLKAVIDVMHFWLDTGVDGLRLDAIPYLVERDGTSNENLPETHDVIRKIRAALDSRWQGKMLLAEANMWPEDVRPYFGDGDECHMAFHFPLMPRIYMAVAQEDRHPLADIMRQTPDIPENCQWATFLRNHDELTLEMVTDRERDYMWNFYAADKRARINVGIRRRLAPLMGNDRRKIELLNSLLFSMPGTPIIYYGDELGMGDNIFLGDRNGVRTPMQWSPDRNGGFSLADPNYLYLPAIMDPLYGFQAVNVEAQRRNPNSLLNWMRALIAAVKDVKSFGRGALRILTPANRKVMAYLREHEGEIVLCVANLSRSPQAVELDLKEFAGRIPVELLGRSDFPAIGELPYFITLPSYGFYWFRLREPDPASMEAPLSLPELHTLVVPRGWTSLIEGSARRLLQDQILPAWLNVQRWYGSKGAGLPSVEILGATEIARDSLVVLLQVTPARAEPQLYQLALSITWEMGLEDPLQTLGRHALARVRQGPRVGILHDAAADARFSQALLESIATNRSLSFDGGEIRFQRTERFPDDVDLATLTPRAVGVEQSNTSVLFGDRLIGKLLRRLEPGEHPEAEITRFLSKNAPDVNAPALYGTIDLARKDGSIVTLAVLQQMIPNQGDGWTVTTQYLDRYLAERRATMGDDPPESAEHSFFRELARRLGVRTGELHRAFALVTGDPAFDPEPVTDEDRADWLGVAKATLDEAMEQLGAARSNLSSDNAEMADRLLARRADLAAKLEAALPPDYPGAKTRIHGDFHLGQVLVAKNDFYILDFEGEPARPLAYRRAKHSPLRDLAGLLRSVDYAGHAATMRARAEFKDEPDQLAAAIATWRRETIDTFMAGYDSVAAGIRSLPADRVLFDRALEFFLVEKACYELRYELANRPDWVAIPLTGLLALLDS